MTTVDNQFVSLFNRLLSDDCSLTSQSPLDSSLFLHKPVRFVYDKTMNSTDQQRSVRSNDDLNDETAQLHTLKSKIGHQVVEQQHILDSLSYQFDHVMIV
jgi:hypothetical protein